VLLAVDTCLTRLTLSVRRTDDSIVSVSEEIGVGHAEKIAPAFQRVMRDAGEAPSSIKRIGVTVGPGSFMGQRVGIAFAKGIAMATGAKTVPLTTLHAFAHQGGGQGAAVIDARRSEVYLQRFDGVRALEEPSIVTYEDARDELAGVPRRFGNAGDKLGLPFVGEDYLTPEALLELTAQGVPGVLRTLYLRAPDAKPSRSVL
jgi:tRNA threonylcarbamoyladenosine biosynthesis protein TsaB